MLKRFSITIDEDALRKIERKKPKVFNRSQFFVLIVKTVTDDEELYERVMQKILNIPKKE